MAQKINIFHFFGFAAVKSNFKYILCFVILAAILIQSNLPVTATDADGFENDFENFDGDTSENLDEDDVEYNENFGNEDPDCDCDVDDENDDDVDYVYEDYEDPVKSTVLKDDVYLTGNNLSKSNVNDADDKKKENSESVGNESAGKSFVVDDTKIVIPVPDPNIRNVVPDVHLRIAINKQLDRENYAGWITEDDLSDLTVLDAESSDIKSIEGLQYAVHLTHLDLSENDIRNLQPIGALTSLTFLSLSENERIRDFSHLSNLEYLVDLEMDDVGIEYLSPLQNMTRLEKLSLSENGIESLEPLQNLKRLQELDVRNNFISNVSVLENLMYMKDIDISGNKIQDLSPLQNMTRLEKVNASGNEISDLSSLKNLKNIKELYVQNNTIHIESKGKTEIINPLKDKNGSTLHIMEQDGVVSNWPYIVLSSVSHYPFHVRYAKNLDMDNYKERLDGRIIVYDETRVEPEYSVIAKDETVILSEFRQKKGSIFHTDNIPQPFNKGYIFSGWQLNEKRVNKIKVENDTVLTATWEKLPVFVSNSSPESSAGYIDLLLLIQYIGGIGPLFENKSYTSVQYDTDLNGDGKSDFSDVFIMLKNM